jgi:hypothetical protein
MKLSEILDVDNPPPQNTATTTTTSTSVATVPVAPAPPAVVVHDVTASANNDVTKDALEARNTVRLMISQGNEAVKEMLALAKDLKSPRAYEVAANLLKTMSELSQDLLQVHQQEAILIDPDTRPTGNVHIENAVFVGSTSDLQDMIKLKREEKKKIIEVKQIEANSAQEYNGS